MPSNYLTLCRPFVLLPSIFPSIRVFYNESVICIRWPNYWGFRFSISLSNEYSGFLEDWLIWSPCSPRDSQEYFPKSSGLQCSAFFIVYLSNPYMNTGLTIALTRWQRSFDWTSVSKIMSLLFNMLSRLVTAFLARSKCLLISWWWSPSAVILEPKKIKSVTVLIFSLLFAMKWWDWMPWS